MTVQVGDWVRFLYNSYEQVGVVSEIGVFNGWIMLRSGLAIKESSILEVRPPVKETQ